MNDTTIGPYLKKRRTAKKMSLEIVSQKTKINTTALENLESERFDLLPSKTYVKGYIKSLATVYGENSEELLSLFEDSYNPPLKTQENLKYFPLTEEVKSKAFTKVLISATLILAVSGYAIYFFYNKTQTKLSELKDITPQQVTAETPLQVDIAPPKEVVAEPEPTPEVKPEPAPELKPEPVPEVVEEKKEETKFYKITKTLYTYRTEKVKETVDNYLPTKFQNSVVPHKQNVFVNAVHGDTWLTYKADDSAIRKFVLKKGRSILIRGKLVRLFLGNVKSTVMFLNNRPLTIDSRTGVKSLVFPQEQKEDYHLPLFVFKDDGTVITSEEFLSSN
jgi:cytoskeletal protein RodZ